MIKLKKVYLGLGSNLGNRLENINAANAMVEKLAGKILALSSLYETEPWGFETDNKFINMVMCINTNLSPSELLNRLLMIEAKLGRAREEGKYISRTIDIDILFYGDEVIDDDVLHIPHPRLHERRFVLTPLNEIAPGLLHPVLKKNVESLSGECRDKSGVVLYSDN